MSTIAERKTTYTPEDLLAMPDGKNYELVDGRLVERNVSNLTSWLGGEIFGKLRDHCNPGGLAWVFGSDCGYRCFPDRPKKIRRPDVSCVLRSRLTLGQLEEGFVPVAPDLAVEVISPKDRAYQVDIKVHEYLNAGTKLVWVVLPPSRSVWVYRADGSGLLVNHSGMLDGEDVLPGFACRVGDLFPTV